MKPIITLLAAMLFTMTLQAQVGIGTTTPQAAFDIVSSTDGLLIPRVALTSLSSFAPLLIAPEDGELVFNTADVGTLTKGFYYWSTGNISWVRIGDTVTPPPPPPSFGGWLLAGNAAVSTDFIGTTNPLDLLFRRGGVLSGRLGEFNTFYGRLAGGSINNGTFNTYIGRNAGALLNSTAQNNTAVGFNALQSQPGRNSSQNTAIGAKALENASGNNNTAIGNEAGANNGGSNNVIIGHQASIGNGNNSVAIGNGANSGAWSNSVAIGSGATSTGSNQITLGNGATGVLRCSATTITALSDRRDKADIITLSEGIEFIKQLKPVTYSWNARDKSKVGTKAVGFIAQDLLKLQQESPIGENLDLVSYHNPDKLEARYGNLLPVMVKGIQDQQTLIEKLQKDNEQLKATNIAILKRLDALEAGKVTEVSEFAQVGEKK
jgi:hypothetical protein